MNTKIELRRVEFIPKILEGKILYASDRFKVAAHLCPCGCGNKIITPLGSCEWSLSVKRGKPTLDPSIGNWQIPCKSHYWIRNGRIEWSYAWTEEEVQEGRNKEQARRELYYREKASQKPSVWKRLKKWISKKSGY